MHEFTPQKAKLCKHARKTYDYQESLNHKTNICKVCEVSDKCLHKNMHAFMHYHMAKHAQLNRETIKIFSIKINFYIILHFYFFLKHCTNNFSKLFSRRLMHLSDSTLLNIENDSSTSQEMTGPYLSAEIWGKLRSSWTSFAFSPQNIFFVNFMNSESGVEQFTFLSLFFAATLTSPQEYCKDNNNKIVKDPTSGRPLLVQQATGQNLILCKLGHAAHSFC